MKVHVHYTTQLKASLRTASETVDLEPESRISSLVQRLAQRHGTAFSDLVLDERGRPLPSMLICVDDQQVNATEDVELRDGQEVVFLAAISGG